MSPTPDEIREQQKAAWNAFSPGWRKWDDATMDFLRPMGEAIIAALELKPDSTVLDVATGTGEPGLTIAGLAPRGRVVGTDLAEGMLETARAAARQKGLKNYEAKAADVSALPFPDASFTAVSCRMGYMFFPDMAQATREMARVLKPGGRIATSVWGPREQNPWVATLMGIIHQRLHLPAPPPGAPGMFRCAASGLIANLFREAGLVDVTEKEIQGDVTYPSAESYWIMMTEIAAPVASALSKTDDAGRAQIRQDVLEALGGNGGPVTRKFGALIISGRRP